MTSPPLSLAQTAHAVARGERRATDVIEACIARIEATDARVNAFTGTRFDAARAQAQRVDAQRARGEPLGPLAGVPFAVKNLFDIAGEVTLAGSKVNRSHPPAATDAVLVQRLQAAGAVLVGSLNMDEYAYGFTTENTHYGPTRHPHNLRCVAGGSSGGSGAAVAAGQVPLTLGSDTNGSIRVPSSFCGVWGLKPTFGRLSRRGSFPFVHSIDHLGPLADDLPGLALAYDALQGPDPLDPGCLATGMAPVAQALDLGVKDLRNGVLGGYFTEHATAPAQQAVSLAADALGAHTGVHHGVQWPDAAQARAAAFIVTASEGGSLHLPALREHAADYEPLSVDRLISGALQPATWYARAQRFRRVYRDKVNDLFRHWDVLIAPATPLAAPAIGTEWIDIHGQRFPCRPSIGLLTQPISFSGCPVVTAPLWPTGTGGLPLGVQIIAAPWREDLAFRAAQVLAQSGVAHVKEVTL
jgi:amidase/aspartyl-tRNA(Asn)/glutamyl-tRNA(Gln) amidotransferase subunit A